MSAKTKFVLIQIEPTEEIVALSKSRSKLLSLQDEQIARDTTVNGSSVLEFVIVEIPDLD